MLDYKFARQLSLQQGIRHGFFTRLGGVSTGIFRELNCGGRGVIESAEVVDENRRRVAATLGIVPENLYTVYQVHGPAVVTITSESNAAERPQADALVTAEVGLGLGVLTADCAPVLFADPIARVIGAAHAGWKGATGGVLQATVHAMESLGATRTDISAAIGPTIAQASYEVDREFYLRLLAADVENERYFTPLDAGGHAYFHLPSYVHDVLQAQGLKQVENLGIDTYTGENEFYSFRRATHRGETDYGRQISVIVLAQKDDVCS